MHANASQLEQVSELPVHVVVRLMSHTCAEIMVKAQADAPKAVSPAIIEVEQLMTNPTSDVAKTFARGFFAFPHMSDNAAKAVSIFSGWAVCDGVQCVEP